MNRNWDVVQIQLHAMKIQSAMNWIYHQTANWDRFIVFLFHPTCPQVATLPNGASFPVQTTKYRLKRDENYWHPKLQPKQTIEFNYANQFTPCEVWFKSINKRVYTKLNSLLIFLSWDIKENRPNIQTKLYYIKMEKNVEHPQRT